MFISNNARSLLKKHGLYDKSVPLKPLISMDEAISMVLQHREEQRAEHKRSPEVDLVVDACTMAQCTPLYALKPWQSEVVKKITNEDGTLRTGILVSPTGSGKTLMAIHAMRKASGPVLICTNGVSDRTKWADVLRKMGVTTRVLGDDQEETIHFGKFGAIVTTFTLFSYSKDRESSLKPATRRNLTKARATSFACVVIDEAHLAPTKTFSKVFESFHAAQLCLTATLQRRDGRHELLPGLVGGTILHEVKEADIPELKSLEHYRTSVPMHEAFQKAWKSNAYQRNLLSALNPWKLAAMQQIIHAQPGKHLIFCDHVKLLAAIKSVLTAQDISVFGPLSGESSKKRRDQTIKDFQGESGCTCLLISKIGAVALDTNAKTVIHLTHPTDPAQARQRNGRVGRNGKEGAAFMILTEGSPECNYVSKRDAEPIRSWSGESRIGDVLPEVSSISPQELLEACRKVPKRPQQLGGDGPSKRPRQP